ncbi:MAG TPA: NADH-quinone oxidoreductase subunit C [Pirellulaceae bacterium]
MAENKLLTRLRAQVGDGIVGGNFEAMDPWIEVTSEALPVVCRYLKSESDLRFEMLNCITAVDYFEPDPKKAAKVEWSPHMELVYHLSSITKKHTLVVKVQLPRWRDDQVGSLPVVPTVSDIWRTADWHEREVYDLSGIWFQGHPGLNRILCPEDWEGHPLRKDYEMPLEYHGIRGR